MIMVLRQVIAADNLLQMGLCHVAVNNQLHAAGNCWQLRMH